MMKKKSLPVIIVLAVIAISFQPIQAKQSPDFHALADNMIKGVDSSPYHSQEPPPGWPEDAQSTTGPTPTPGVDTRGWQPRYPATLVVIPHVPAYNWYRGCGPTAAGMVLGYWDGRGYDKLIPGDASTQTSAVDQAIASTGNYNDYCLPLDYSPGPLLPDKSAPPPGDEHSNNCVADFMKTSQSASSNYYGWSWYSDVDDAFNGYVPLVASDYTWTATNQMWGTFNWTGYKAEIDAGRPVVLLVDTNGNGSTDHFITAVGYSDDGGTNRYGAYNTWDTALHWYDFRQMGSGKPWGIYGATLFSVSANLPAAFNKADPANGSILPSTSPTIKWGTSSCATSYEYCLDTINDDVCNSSWMNVGSATSKLLSSLTKYNTYYWQVRARNSAGFKEANSWQWWSFTPGSGIYLPLNMKNFIPCTPLYQDDFSDPASGWPVSDDGNLRYEYLGGEYRMLVRNTYWWSGARPGFQASDYVLEADVRNFDGHYGSYGLIFGQNDWNGFYAFLVFSNGNYSIRRRTSGSWVILSENWSSYVNTGTASNHLKVKREGSQIYAYVNGHFLANVSDGTYTGSKYVGLITRSDYQNNVDARFDNFVVYPLSCGGAGGAFPRFEFGDIGLNAFDGPDSISKGE